MPEAASAKKLAEAFAKFETVENLKMCLLRLEVAGNGMPEALKRYSARLWMTW